MKINESLKEYFTFTRKELRGIMVLSFLILVLVLLRQGVPWMFRNKEPDFSRFEEAVKRFEASLSDSVRNFAPIPVIHADTDERFERKAFKPVIDPVELNSADSSALVALKGIGPVLSSRILKYRKMLGGFTAMEQLLEVYGLDSLKWTGLLPLVTIDVSLVRPLDINQASFKELLNHPYLEYEHVKEMVRYREKNNGFHSPDEVLLLESIDSTLWRKLIPYLNAGGSKMPGGNPESGVKQ
jgi:DNA uptake protein ComE-like DNA-binding protein